MTIIFIYPFEVRYADYFLRMRTLNAGYIHPHSFLCACVLRNIDKRIHYTLTLTTHIASLSSLNAYIYIILTCHILSLASVVALFLYRSLSRSLLHDNSSQLTQHKATWLSFSRKRHITFLHVINSSFHTISFSLYARHLSFSPVSHLSHSNFF